jgi:hypothetical protein
LLNPAPHACDLTLESSFKGGNSGIICIFAANKRTHNTKLMKRILQLSTLILVLSLAFLTDSYTQRMPSGRTTDADRYFDERGNFASRLWYGGGFTLGFSGNNLESIFQLGISPMVGYKITDDLSIGPRASLMYIMYRAETFTIDGFQTANLFNYGLGAFARFKFARVIFAHAEYGFDNQISGLAYNPNTRNWDSSRRLVNNAFLGLGYNSGTGMLGYEIYLLYNLLQEENTINLPFDIRFGITYNF